MEKIASKVIEKQKKFYPIENLNCYCFAKIFVYLSNNDRLNLEKVSRKVRDLCLFSWHDVRKIEIESSNNYPIVKKILPNYGKYLFELSWKEYEYDSQLISLINDYCNHLKKLEIFIYFPDAWHKDCNNIIKKWKYMKTLSLWNWKFEYNSMNILTQNIQLTSLTLSQCKIYNNGHLLSNLKNLEYLKLYLNIDGINDNDITCIINNCKKLKTLIIDNLTVQLSINVFDAIGSLIDLEILNLSGQKYINNASINNIINNCKKLKSIYITSMLTTSMTLNKLGCLKNLKSIYLPSCNGVNDYVLNGFLNIEKLHCYKCYNVTDFGIKYILDNSPNINYLNVINTCITIDTINYAWKIRKNKCKKLIIYVDKLIYHYFNIDKKNDQYLEIIS
ncbi:hypothetical protein HCN44_004999 [Aphidius gifuensis]|uniref:Uncharacterized protein n=1 Tax=Aphidius gifuensis TaxID=684658 RepID=A0A834XSJ6_APHGI|nr:hypothetical protein HCN44_004999 [Aphidius gifuensis]